MTWTKILLNLWIIVVRNVFQRPLNYLWFSRKRFEARKIGCLVPTSDKPCMFKMKINHAFLISHLIPHFHYFAFKQFILLNYVFVLTLLTTFFHLLMFRNFWNDQSLNGIRKSYRSMPFTSIALFHSCAMRHDKATVDILDCRR